MNSKPLFRFIKFKKSLNFDDLTQIFSTKSQENSLVINANIKKAKTQLNRTSTNSDSYNLDDIEIQINKMVG
ncbi:hypothetical protein [Mesomycoplasma ovipneumoniae]